MLKYKCEIDFFPHINQDMLNIVLTLLSNDMGKHVYFDKYKKKSVVNIFV